MPVDQRQPHGPWLGGADQGIVDRGVAVRVQQTHHLTDEQIVTHWREAWRVTRDAIFISDLHRNALLYTLVWITLRVMRSNRNMVDDGLTSVRRGFQLPEWRDLAVRAGIPAANVWRYQRTRILLQARKKIPGPVAGT